jgi:hypothetical protein
VAKGASSIVSINKPSKQSTTQGDGKARLANDGISQTIQKGSAVCTSTEVEDKPWWMVDLESVYGLEKVKLFNRKDACCSNSISNIIIEISPDKTFWKQCYKFEKGTAGPGMIYNLPCHGNARYLRITSLKRTSLSLCEVEIYGGETYPEVAKPTKKPTTVKPPKTTKKPVNVIPQGPVDLSDYSDKIGQTFQFYVTGALGGVVYGTGVYTFNSNLATAAVHVGLLAVGERRAIRVSILPGQSSYWSSTLNGVTSNDRGAATFSFSFPDAPAIVTTTTTTTESPAIPAPYNMVGYRAQVGQTYTWSITGTTSGNVWGTDIYTDDSSIAAAAVHVGLVSVGQTKNVRVTMLAGLGGYVGSTRNGITSSNYGNWWGSYKFPDAASLPQQPITAPANMVGYRGQNSQTFTFTLTGATGGSVWGTDIYTDDSILAAAAVHAGKVNVGETKTVRVTVLPGQGSYTGTPRNGVSSLNYGNWWGSYRFE